MVNNRLTLKAKAVSTEDVNKDLNLQDTQLNDDYEDVDEQWLGTAIGVVIGVVADIVNSICSQHPLNCKLPTVNIN